MSSRVLLDKRRLTAFLERKLGEWECEDEHGFGFDFWNGAEVALREVLSAVERGDFDVKAK